jgi:flagellar basal body P-ring formation protein FlgA
MKHATLALIGLLIALPGVSHAAITQPIAQSAQGDEALFTLNYEDAEEAVAKTLAAKGYGTSVGASINGRKTTPLYSSNKPVSVEIRGLRADTNGKSWSASMLILSDDVVISAMPLAGRYMEMVEIPTLKRAVRNGDVIAQEDITLKQYPADRMNGDTITDIAGLIGKSPVRSISAGRAVRTQEIAMPTVIKKNAIVQMRYKNGTMEISTTGQVLNDGATGDVVMVKNTTSNKTVRAVVADEHTVDVMPGGVQTSKLEQTM